MHHKHSLMYVLSAIVLLNIIAIVMLNMRLEDAPASVPSPVQPNPEMPAAIPEPEDEVIAAAAPRPLVRTLILEDKERCSDCFDVRQYIDELKDVVNMKVDVADPFPFKSEKLPAIAFNQTVEEYPSDFIEGWESFGYTIRIPTGEYAGTWYVLPILNAPYFDTRSNVIEGRVIVTYLTMTSCKKCYDVSVHEEFLRSSRIQVHEEIFVDVTSPEGRRVVEKYGIAEVPTIIMSDDVDAYTNVRPGWETVGTIEEDGTYVLRNLQRLQVVYYDLKRKEVMTP